MSETADIVEGLAKLNVAPNHNLESEPVDSPTALADDMREWLNTALDSSNNPSSSNVRLYTKLLVSNAAAGSIIGKAGGNINEFQAKTFSRIQLSKSGEYYPGTAERTLLVTGRLKQIIAALGLVFSKLQREGVAPVTPRSRAALEAREPDSDPPVSHLAIKLLVPQPLCGIIIGKGGTTVRTYSAETNTQIRVTAPDGPALGLNHRVVTINGLPDDCLKAISLLTLKQAEDPKYQLYSELPSSYASHVGPIPQGGMPPYAAPHPYMLGPQVAAAGGHAMQLGYPAMYTAAAGPPVGGPGSSGSAGGAQGMYPTSPQGMYSTSHDGLATMTFHLPDDQANVLMAPGPNGHSAIEDVQAMAGVRIRVEVSGEAGTSSSQNPQQQQGRLAQVTVTGPPENLQYAHYMLAQRLAMVAMHQQYMVANPANGAAYYQAYRPAMAAGPYGAVPGSSHGHHQYGAGGMEGDTHSQSNSRRPSPRTVVIMPGSGRSER